MPSEGGEAQQELQQEAAQEAQAQDLHPARGLQHLVVSGVFADASPKKKMRGGSGGDASTTNCVEGVGGFRLLGRQKEADWWMLQSTRGHRAEAQRKPLHAQRPWNQRAKTWLQAAVLRDCSEKLTRAQRHLKRSPKQANFIPGAPDSRRSAPPSHQSALRSEQ